MAARTTAAGEKPKRSQRSCDSCFRRKIRCEMETAGRPCENCLFHHLDCTFTRPTNTRQQRVQKSDKTNRVVSLKDRLDRLESVFKSIGLPISPDRLDSDKRTASTLRGVRITKKRLVSADFSIPFLSRQGQRWIQFAGSSGPASPIPGLPDGRNNIDLSLSPTLPAELTIRGYLQLYIASSFAEVFPVIRGSTFAETISRAYRDPPSTSAQACVLAFYAISPMFMWEAGSNASPLPSQDSAICNLLFPHILTGQPSLELAQTLLMMAMLTSSAGSFESVDVHLCLAVRTLFALGAHLPPSHDSADEHHYRDLFWIAYCLDTEFAIRAGRPPIINDETCDLSFPDDAASISAIGFSSDRSVLGLSIIKSEAYSKLYAYNALNKSDVELLRSIRHLDQALEEWRLSLPADVRPALTYREDASPPGPANIKWMILRLQYHHCVATIHQAVTRLTARSTDHDAAISSSLDIASDASRSILLYFRDHHKHLPPFLFWVYSAWPIMAVLMLFCDMISATNPPSPAQVHPDLDLLQDASNGLRDMGHAVNPDSAQIKHLTAFLETLVHLARTVVAVCHDPQAAEEQLRLKRELSM